jgi:hypothetical protein
VAFKSLVKQKIGTSNRKDSNLAEASSIINLNVGDETDAESVVTIKGNIDSTAQGSLQTGQVDLAPKFTQSSGTSIDVRTPLPRFDTWNRVPANYSVEEFDEEDYPGLIEPAGSCASHPSSNGRLYDESCSAADRKGLEGHVPIPRSLELPSAEMNLDGSSRLPQLPALEESVPRLPHSDSNESSDLDSTKKKTKNVSFCVKPKLYYRTWSVAKGDRKGPVTTSDRLTPSIASAIKTELNEFKLTVSNLSLHYSESCILTKSRHYRWRFIHFQRSIHGSFERMEAGFLGISYRKIVLYLNYLPV